MRFSLHHVIHILPNFPTQLPYRAKLKGSTNNAFVTKLTPAGNGLVCSTYLGGSGDGTGNGATGFGIAVPST